MNEEIKTLVTIINHRAQVAARLRELAQQLEKRANLHDLSKFKLDELDGYVKLNVSRRFPGESPIPYDSPEYKAILESNKSPLELHFARNRHHPEFHTNGVSDMALIDFIEMVVDWLAATEAYGTPFRQGLEKQTGLYNLQPDHLYLIDLIARHFGE